VSSAASSAASLAEQLLRSSFSRMALPNASQPPPPPSSTQGSSASEEGSGMGRASSKNKR
jgi:hypothetical protein